MEESEMIEIANFLCSIGYNFNPQDDFWMEEFVDEHSWKDIFGLMKQYAEHKINASRHE